MGRKRYTHVLGRTYILIRSRVLWPVVLVDMVGYALRRLYRAVVGPARAQGETAGEVRSILAIRLDHIGDVLLTTPALTLLKRRWPQARITCLVGSWSADILRGNPAVEVQSHVGVAGAFPRRSYPCFNRLEHVEPVDDIRGVHRAELHGGEAACHALPGRIADLGRVAAAAPAVHADPVATRPAEEPVHR